MFTCFNHRLTGPEVGALMYRTDLFSSDVNSYFVECDQQPFLVVG